LKPLKLYEKLPTRIKRQLNKLYTYFPDRTIITDIDGITYKLDLSKLVHSQMYFYGYWEKYTTKLFDKYIIPGMTVMDIGASTGVHTLRMAKLVGITGLVYAFEPSNWMYERLCENISLNNFHNIVVEKFALSEVDAKAIFLSEQHDRVDKKQNSREYIKMDYVKLDTYVKRMTINKIDFIKIDVDGYETRVLEGAKQTIKKNLPIMVIEMGRGLQEAYERSLEELITLLESFGYKFYNEKTEEEYQNLIESLPEKASVNVLCKV